MAAPLSTKPRKISLYLDPADLWWLEVRAEAASASLSTIARQVFRAAREAAQQPAAAPEPSRTEGAA